MTSDAQDTPSINPEPTDGPLPYPTRQVVGIFDDAEAAAITLQRLGEAGVALDTVTVFFGEAGAQRWTATAEGGAGGWVTRLLRSFGGEQEDIREYEQAVMDGAYVLTVPADDDAEKARAGEAMRANGGFRVRHYGANTVEDL
ncbi:MAG: hypothetical protein M0R73_13645 [Dehalococcoidia bacterium]|nr:hypothetical protein [Dehalococcoidia bacterium]